VFNAGADESQGEKREILFSKLQQREDLRSALASGQFVDVNFGKLGKRQTDEINRIRTENGQPLMRDGDFVLPAHIVKHLYDSRIVTGNMDANKVADMVHSILTNTATRVKTGRNLDTQELIRVRSRLSQLGILGRDFQGNDVLITAIPKSTRRAWK
jgi:hypothetical protein